MKIIVTIIALALIGWGVYALVNNDGAGDVIPTGNDTQAYLTPAQGTATSTSTSSPAFIPEAVKEFTVSARNFSFSPATMQVNKGDRVRITFKNDAGTHDWVIDEFNARTKVLQGGQSETIEFVADEAGSFEYYCSVGSHRQMGMVGTLTVR